MGFNFSFVACPQDKRKELLDGLKRKEDDWAQAQDLIPTREADTIADISADWTVFFTKSDKVVTKDLLAALSKSMRVVAGAVWEGPMFASGEEWQGGKCLWQSRYEDGEIVSEGDLPEFDKTRAANFMDEEEDFEYPLVLADSVCGYFYTETNSKDDLGDRVKTLKNLKRG